MIATAKGEANKVVDAINKNQQPGQVPNVMPQAPPTMPDAINNKMNAYGQQAAERKAALDKHQGELAPTRESYAIWWAEFGPNGSCINARCHNPDEGEPRRQWRCGVPALRDSGQSRSVPGDSADAAQGAASGLLCVEEAAGRRSGKGKARGEEAVTKTFALIGLAAGTLLALMGGGVPDWLRNLECLTLMLAALAFGFAARNPCHARLAPLGCRAGRGTCLYRGRAGIRAAEPDFERGLHRFRPPPRLPGCCRVSQSTDFQRCRCPAAGYHRGDSTMKRFLAFLFALSMLSAGGRSHHDRALESSVQVHAGEGDGMGVWVDHDLVITAYHVIRNQPGIWVSRPGGTWMLATVLATDPTTDLALLKVDGWGKPMPLATQSARPGDWLFIVSGASIPSAIRRACQKCFTKQH